MTTISIPTRSKWVGEDGMDKYITEQTRCNVWSGVGICIRKNEKTAILRSVDDTYYYANNLDDPNNVEYTLYGQNGDQDEREPRYNEPLLNPEKTEHIYLYRVRPKSREKYMFYGKYTIGGRIVKPNRGRDGIMRNVIVLKLTKIND